MADLTREQAKDIPSDDLIATIVSGENPDGTTWSGMKTQSPATTTLPTNASTSAKQDTGNTSLNSIDGKLPVAAAPADAVTNAENATSIRARLIAYNGATWDRIRSGVTAVTSVFTGFLNMLPWGIYNATPTTRTEGQGGPIQTHSDGSIMTYIKSLFFFEDAINSVATTVLKPLSVSTYAPSRDTSAALEASSISKASAGNLIEAYGSIDKTAASGQYYVLFLDSATLPIDGAVTHLVSPIPVTHISGTDSTWQYDKTKYDVAAANGIVIVLSTTMVIKTMVTGGNVALFATVLTK